MKYSRFQYFFWLIAGSEISVLKECKNDYNRHATSGALIFATCLIASVIAGFAGYTYGNNNIAAAVIVALIWGYLIFCIDRFMVISLKKDPTIPDDEQPFWKPLSTRLLFAFIIAFFMTIPLYHTFFYTQIETQISNDNVKELAEHQAKLNITFNKNILEAENQSLGKQDSLLNEKLLGECPEPAYTDTIQLYLDCKKNQLPPLKNDYDDLNIRANAIWQYYKQNPCDTLIKRPTDCYSADDWKIVNQRNTARANYNNKIIEMNNLLTRADAIKAAYVNKIKEEIANNDSLQKENSKSLTAANDTINKRKASYDKTLQMRHTDFVAQFVALWRAAFLDLGTLFLVLMLEAAFIMIEIFPTYQKLKTKIGDYDWAIYYKEKSFQERMKSEFEISKATEINRIEIETKLNSDIHNKIAGVELKIAEESLAEWEKEARENKMPIS
jgi:hypothetical protein